MLRVELGSALTPRQVVDVDELARRPRDGEPAWWMPHLRPWVRFTSPLGVREWAPHGIPEDRGWTPLVVAGGGLALGLVAVGYVLGRARR